MDVSPSKQNVDKVFASTTYRIDFYQRDYRWTGEQVERLLDDIFSRFREHYWRLKDLDPSTETISAQYPWYYLNTYVTNTVEGHVYVVDGQQRLTTLTLILIKLFHIGKDFDSKLVKWLDGKIAGQVGYESQFWMNHDGNDAVQQALYEGQEPTLDESCGTTGQNMVRNYRTISTWLERELSDLRTFETFVFYFLHRLVLIELTVEQIDVPMLFEAINDRGMRLRPHEILKGKLLGQINKRELAQDGYNDLWERQAAAINSHEPDLLDEFFRFFLRAKFANTRGEGQRFDGAYHREMFTRDMDNRLGLSRSPDDVKAFLKGEFSYFAGIYERLLSASKQPRSGLQHLYYSRLLDIDAPFLLVLSACHENDSDEDEKIRTIGYEVDRYFSLLQLQNAYDSNDFQRSLYEISSAIREQPAASFRCAFDARLKAAIAARRNVAEAEPLSYGSFRQIGANLNARFKRYFYSRIDEFLAVEMNLNPKHPISDLVTRTGPKTGFHVEHILSVNEHNLALFGNDEDLFEQERNRLGATLLLKGKDNISSGNEAYGEKLKSYANTLYWNETLRADSYKAKLDMANLVDKYDLDLKPLNRFGPEELESRHRLLFDLVKIIWK